MSVRKLAPLGGDVGWAGVEGTLIHESKLMQLLLKICSNFKNHFPKFKVKHNFLLPFKK